MKKWGTLTETEKAIYEQQVSLGKKAEVEAIKYNNKSNICAKSFLKYIDTGTSFESVMNLFSGFKINELANICVNVQEHKCSEKRCLKEVIWEGIKTKECVIGFPFPASDEPYIKYKEGENRQGESFVHISIDQARNKCSDEYINQYNIPILLGARCNIDMRVIIDHHSLLKYLLKYVSKREKKSATMSDIMKLMS